MTNTHLPHDERVASIMQATSELVRSGGIAKLTLTAIATRSGVSRQWLYEIFPDLNSILAELYTSTMSEFMHDSNAGLPEGDQLIGYLQQRARHYLSIPVSCAIIGLYAINNNAESAGESSPLRRAILANLENAWARPLISRGFNSDDVYASILSVLNAILGLVVGIDAGLTTMEAAERRLVQIIAAASFLNDPVS